MMETPNDVAALLEKLDASWPSAAVARHELQRFSGGLLHPRTVANLDSRGEGPRPRFNCGRIVAYDKAGLLQWLGSRLEVSEKQKAKDEVNS